MTDLRRAVKELGFENVSTYGQSGNVVFADELKLHNWLPTLKKS